jgi:hypothetical protein
MPPLPRSLNRPIRWLPGSYGIARCVATAIVTLPLSARAEPPALLELEVERDPGAADCPDAPALRSTLLAAGAQPIGGPVLLRVRFERTGDEYHATVRTSGARSGVRSLSVRESHCGPLVEALSVSIVLLLDPDGPGAGPPEADPAPTPPNTPETAPGASPAETAPAPDATATARDSRAPPAATRAEHGDRGSTGLESSVVAVDVTPTFVVGFTPSWTVGGELGATVRQGPGSIRAGAGAFLPRDAAHAGGRVAGFLLSARASACLDWPVGASGRLGGCATGLAGRLSVEGSGYADNLGVVRPLWAVGPELIGTWSVGDTWGWNLRAASLFSLARNESFFVEGAEGSAFSVARVSPWLGLGLWSTIW